MTQSWYEDPKLVIGSLAGLAAVLAIVVLALISLHVLGSKGIASAHPSPRPSPSPSQSPSPIPGTVALPTPSAKPSPAPGHPGGGGVAPPASQPPGASHYSYSGNATLQAITCQEQAQTWQVSIVAGGGNITIHRKDQPRDYVGTITDSSPYTFSTSSNDGSEQLHGQIDADKMLTAILLDGPCPASLTGQLP